MFVIQIPTVFTKISKALGTTLKLLKAKARPSPIEEKNKLKLGTEQLANILKKIKAN